MTTTNDGGPAFPMPIINGGYSIVQGMTLRDYFAAKAMQAIISKFPPEEPEPGIRPEDMGVARGAYEYADAMLAARAEKGGAS